MYYEMQMLKDTDIIKIDIRQNVIAHTHTLTHTLSFALYLTHTHTHTYTHTRTRTHTHLYFAPEQKRHDMVTFKLKYVNINISAEYTFRKIFIQHPPLTYIHIHALTFTHTQNYNSFNGFNEHFV